MAVIINSINDSIFSINSIQYPKIYQTNKQGVNNISILNIQDSKQQLLSATHFSEFIVEGETFTTQASAMAAILSVVYNNSNSTLLTAIQALEARIATLEGYHNES
ncbi:hypothetical protein [Olleya marilimosa]|uniref:hypothetical protein n=1 Tax=Olleya marilimosa TaxID=272164 RepID=UPI0030EC20B6|tara:strand:- start:82843 stop:83160 length:318 start_codon:yes stop_codon:yes gene_type:complete